MNASLAPPRRRVRSDVTQTLRLSSDVSSVTHAISPEPAAMSLLCEVMARLRGVDMPVIQFIQLSDISGDAEVATKFAQTSAACLGRTLLVRLSASRAQRLSLGMPATGVTVAGRRARKPIGEPIEIVPDSAVSGLSHACIGTHLGNASQTARMSAESWLDGTALDFKLIVIASDPPASTPATLELATRCHGSVLVVSAGHTVLSHVHIVTRQLRLVGGTLMGSVLDGAPAPPRLHVLPSWLRPAARPTQ